MKYNGYLTTDEYGLLTCDNSVLVDMIEPHFAVGQVVSVRYFITDTFATEKEVEKALVIQSFGGKIDELKFVLDAWSEYSIEDLAEDLKIGGHDLIDELSNYEGKYLILIIEEINERSNR